MVTLSTTPFLVAAAIVALAGLMAGGALYGHGRLLGDAELPLFNLPAVAAVAIFALLYAFVSAGQFALIGPDEYCRASYGLGWALDPFFAPHDHIWLAGQFYVLGAMWRLIGGMERIVGATSFLGMAATVYLAATLAGHIWRSRAAAVFAGLLVAANSVILWGSFNAVAEVFALPALLLGWYAWLVGHERTARERPGLLTTEPWFLLAGAAIGVGTLFRFELWYAGVALGAYLGVRLVRESIHHRRFLTAPAVLLAMALLAAYPLAWMYSSWRTLGSPTAFAADAARMNVEGNLFYDFSGGWAMFLTYPIVLWQDHTIWAILALPGVALALALLIKRTGHRATTHLLAFLAFLLVAMLVTSRSGIGSNYRPRYTIAFLVLLVPLAAGPLALLWTLPRRPTARMTLRCALILLAGLFALRGAHAARWAYPSGYGIDERALALALRLQRENDPHRPRATTVWPQGPKLEVYFADHPEEFWVLLYHTDRARDLRPLWTAGELARRLAEAGPDTRFLTRLPRPEGVSFERARLLGSVEPYELWTIGH